MDGQTLALTLNRNTAAALSVNGLKREELITTIDPARFIAESRCRST